MRQMVLSALIASDLQGIGDYIARDNPQRAYAFIAEIQAEFERIVRVPESCRSLDWIRPNLRRAVFGKYLIFFTVHPHAVYFHRVLHGAMAWEGPLAESHVDVRP